MIEYMEKYLEELHCQKHVLSQFHASTSIKKLTEVLNKQLSLHRHEAQKSDPTWNNLSVVELLWCVDEDKIQIYSEIEQHLVDKSDFNFLKLHPLHYFSDHYRPIGSLSNASSKLPERVTMNQKQVYQQLNHHVVALMILQMKTRH